MVELLEAWRSLSHLLNHIFLLKDLVVVLFTKDVIEGVKGCGYKHKVHTLARFK